MLHRVLAGSLPESLLESAIGDELNRLLNEPESAAERRAGLRRSAEATASALEGARRALSERRFAAAIAALHQAAAAIAARRCLEQALADRGAVAAERERWVRELDLAPVLGLPAWRIVDRLLALSAVLLAAQEPQRASAVTRLCRQLLARLTKHRAEPDASLEKRLEGLRQLFAASGGGDGARLDRAEDLARQGYANLAARLADELEVEIAGWRAAARAAGAERWRVRMTAELAAIASEAKSLAGRINHNLVPGGES